MIARLRGKVIEAYPNRLVVDVQGVGYEVIVPLSTFDRLHATDGMEVDLRTHLHFGTANQPGQKLFGFATEEERDVFLMLIERVTGELTRIKGLGKKTAERIVLELKDKVGVTDTWQDAAAGAVSPSAADAELALLALGYKQVEARKALRKVLETDPAAAVEALVRGALRVLQG
jgi:Holliday junction DNA helicase RuvA